MKLACSSTAFDGVLRNGDLTQLEWIDLCAHELAADGIVLDVRHFPRTDSDYLAQVKKMAADMGLSIAAVNDDSLFADADRTLKIAVELGAPLAACVLPAQTERSWSETLARIGTATTLAKQLNVTLALRNAPGTFAAGTHDLKRVSKEADSAWLRYGPDFGAFEAGSDPEPLLPRAVLVWAQASEAPVDPLARLLAGFRGFVVLDAPGTASGNLMKNALRSWRDAFFETADRT